MIINPIEIFFLLNLNTYSPDSNVKQILRNIYILKNYIKAYVIKNISLQFKPDI